MAGFQVMPRLAADEYADLESDILANGVQVPITVTEDGRIVDGHHRDEIARKHNLHCPRVTATGSEEELRGLAFSLNLNRRHLNREQRRALIAESLRADPELSNREHARRTGVTDKTVGVVRSELEGSAEIPHFEKRQDPRTGNLSQPASQPTRPEPEPEPEPDDEEDTHAPSWEPAGHIHPADLAALNRPDPTPKPEPSTPRRKPITDDANRIGWELRKVIEKLDTLETDDRYQGAKEKVTPLLRGHLQTAIETCTRMLDNLS